MPSLKFYLLGAPHLEVQGKTISFDTRKATALLAYMVMTASAGGAADHTRDALAALLWPELDQSRARAALRRTLSPLRQAVDKRILDVTRDTLGLKPQLWAATGLWVDAVEFRRLLAAATAHKHEGQALCHDCANLLEQAIALYRDDFMAGFTLRDAPDFDQWQYFESEQLRDALAAALEQLTHHYALLANYDRAVDLARRRLTLDPLVEQAHRQLMQLYAWSGQRSMAVRQYRECLRVLQQELGVSPLEETTALYERILRDDLQPPTPVTAAPVLENQPPSATLPQAAAPVLPLVGRGDEWARMQVAFDAAVKSGHFLVIEGEAGVGKTRLVEEFLKQAPGAVIRARCYEGESSLAYNPFIEGLRHALENASEGWQARMPQHWLAEAARLLPELHPDAGRDVELADSLSGPGAQSRFFEAICRLLLALTAEPALPPGPPPGPSTARTSPGIIFFDDVHWADDASLDLLAYLVTRLANHPLLVLVTWRPEALTSGRRLLALLAAAQRGNHATRITLQRLTARQVESLLDLLHREGHALSEQWRRALYRETEGLPFFLVEYLKSIIGDGAHITAPALPDDATASGEPAPQSIWDMPSGVRALLQSRLDGVDEIGWQLLNTAAVIGRSFNFDTCRLASGRSEEEAVIALEGLLARGLIEEVRASTGATPAPLYDFSHNQIRALVYHETSLVRRRLLHRRVAEALAQHAQDAAPSAQIAQHYRLAGQDAAAAEYFWRAGEHARQLFANAAALSHLRTALALGYPHTAMLHEAIGDLHTLLGDYGDAVGSYEAAAACALAQEQSRLEHKLGSVYDRCGEWQRAESHFQAALAALAVDEGPELQARIYADWSLTAHHQGAAARALSLAQDARRLAQQARNRAALAQVHNILGILARHSGDLNEAQQQLQRSLSLATESGQPSARIAALNNLALVYGADQQEAQARATLEEALRLCQELGDRHREAALLNNLADLHHAAGRSEEAMAHLKGAAAIFAEIGGDIQQWQPEIWKLSEW